MSGGTRNREHMLAYQKAYRERNKEARVAASAEFRRTHPDYARLHKLWFKYRLTGDEYDAMVEAQGGACAICQEPEKRRARTGLIRNLAVDHDRSCCSGGQSCGRCVRALLCGDCNRALGLLRDDPALLRRAAEYIEAAR